ncbi:MAG: M3 family metallopeptidase [Gaiellales bacterium]
MSRGATGWDLSVVFGDDAAAVAAAAALAVEAERFAVDAAGHLGVGLAGWVAELGRLEAELDHVNEYARMRQYADANGPGVHDTVVRVQAAVTAARAALERALDAWRALPDAEAAVRLEDAELEPARYRLTRSRELARHRLSAEAEEVWTARTDAARTRWASLNDNVESALRVRFDDGTGERDWGVGDLGTVARRAEPDVRRAAYAALADAYASINEILAISWDTLVLDRLVEDRLRGRDHPAQATLDDEGMPLAGFLSLVELAPSRSAIRQRMLEAHARRLGLADYSVADVDAPPPGMPPLTYDEVTETAVAGLGTLAPVLGDDARALAALGRIDGETRPGKQQYAVTFSTLLDPPAFLSYRFTGSPANVPLLGHELGHAVALARSAAAQPAVARGWPGVAFEVPSLTAEIAAGDVLAERYPEHAEVARFVAAQDLAWSAFETVAFCHVELDLYAARAGGTVLDADLIRDTFRRRFSDLYGSGVPFDDQDALVTMGGWANYAMHDRFYNFQYAVGALVALALHARRREDPERFATDYVAFLSQGRSASPTDQLARFGLVLDWATWSAGYDELERRFAELT